MKNYKNIKVIKEVTEYEFISITCDICKKDYIYEKGNQDVFEIQEFHHINFTGGFGSVFGDEETIECDICQHCLKEMLGDNYRIID